MFNSVNKNRFNDKSYYFPHDANARNNEKLIQLRMKFGYEGYGIFWAILESLRSAAGYKLQKKYLSGLAFDLKLSEKKVNEIIRYCIELKLFKSNKAYFWSQELYDRMIRMDEAIKKMKAGGQRGAEIREQNKLQNNESSNKNSPVEDKFNVLMS